MTELSVVISTYNRSGVLRDVLADLTAQEAAPPFEIVVVDDGSTDDTAEVAQAVIDSSPVGVAVQLIRQANTGLAAARNTGAAASRGKAIAFLDDDVVVPRDWVRSVVAAFEDESVAAIGGRIDLRFECDVPRWLAPQMRHYLGELNRGDAPSRLEYPDFPFGGHCAVRQDLWRQMGGLDTKFGYRAGSLVPNEERELFRRMSAAGLQVKYWPSARVEHRINAARLTKDWFRRRVHGQGVADEVMELEAARPTIWTAAREAVRTTRALPILLRNIPRGTGAFGAELWLRYCGGRWHALRRARTALTRAG